MWAGCPLLRHRPQGDRLLDEGLVTVARRARPPATGFVHPVAESEESEMGFVTTGFHHATLVCRDAQRTVDFYRDLLGFRLVKRTVNFDRPTTYHLYFGDPAGSPGSLMTFFEWPDAKRGQYGVGGIHHIAMKTEDDETLLKWKRRLTDSAVPVSGPYNRGWFHSIYFRDPDGQVLEIATAGPGYDLDEPIDQLGRELKMPPQGQLRGHRDETGIAAQTFEEPVLEITPDMTLTTIHHVPASPMTWSRPTSSTRARSG